jgi:hypothetical protein
MEFQLREADTEVDGQVITSTVSRYLTRFRDPNKRYDWLYKNNPHGRVRSWIATDNRNMVIGIASAFPRRVFVDEKEIVAWVLGDFCISSGHRSLGAALKLQKTLLNEVDSGAVPFCYDFPSTGMMAVYKRLSIPVSSQMIRLAKPLRLDRQVERCFNNPKLVRGISTIGNLVLKLTQRKMKASRDLVFSLHHGPCQEEFTGLAREIRGNNGVCVLRSAEYLNWRFLTNPYCEHQLLTARRDGALVAYAIFTMSDGTGAIVDLFGFNEERVLSGLIDDMVRVFQTAGVITASVVLLESHPWRSIFERRGFRPRETKPIVVYRPRVSENRPKPMNSRGWFLMDGDRDS